MKGIRGEKNWLNANEMKFNEKKLANFFFVRKCMLKKI